MKIGIIGGGLIGQERLQAIEYITKNIDNNIKLLCVFDSNKDVLEKIKQKYNIPTVSFIDEMWLLKPDWVFICTPHDMIKPLIKLAFQNGTNILVEKPLGKSLEECNEIISCKPDNLKLHVGFNYRFFAGVEALLKDCSENKFGKLISVNMTLAHGNAPGMEKSWKLDPIKCGGGCLIDPGVHLLDLILNMSSGNVSVENVKSWSGFWNTGIEEETHLLLSDSNGTIFNTQISLNRWRSTFKLEINGTEGYGIVEGRGRSYGNQSYRTGVRWGWQSGKSQIDSENIVVENYNCVDSFIKETISVLNLSDCNSTSKACDYNEAKNVMSLLNECQQKINK